jgi:hypothetical protein
LAYIIAIPDCTESGTSTTVGSITITTSKELLEQFQDYSDVFNLSVATILLEHHPMEHKIELILDKELL